MSRLGIAVAYVVAILLPISLAGEELTCPESASVRQTAVDVPAGWEATSVSGAVHLERVSFYLKHPKLGGALVPEKTDRQKRIESVAWKFVRRSGEEFWLGCLYSDTAVIVTQKLRADISQCVVQYDLLPSGERIRMKAITCK